MSRPLRVMISAGEASGDRLGAGLARALAQRRPGIEIFGMGGKEMSDAGVRLVQNASEVAVVGFVEVLSHFGAIRRAMARLREAMEREKPDLLVPVDFPDFNLRLAAVARRSGVPVVYFVSPQVWAWRRGRVRRIKDLVRRMLVLFPFEASFYEEAGVPVTFVGHPALDAAAVEVDAADLRSRAGLAPGRRVVAFLPGSRQGELKRLLPPMLGAARLLAARIPDLQFLIPRALTIPAGSIEAEVAGMGLERDVRVHAGDYPQILAVCDAAAVASGTATLDAALAGVPMVVVYRMRTLSYALARLLVRVEHIGLVNLVAGGRVVPELIQGECTPERIADQLATYLASPADAARIRTGLAEVRSRLGRAGAFDRAADAVLAELPVGAA